jgi:hypothetical protein
MSPIVVERRARTGDPAAGAHQDAAILAQFGEVDLDSPGGERTASLQPSLIKSHLRFRVSLWRMEAVSPNRPI